MLVTCKTSARKQGVAIMIGLTKSSQTPQTTGSLFMVAWSDGRWVRV